MTRPNDGGDRATIAVVDDHALFREGLRELFSTEPDLVVVGEAGDSRSAVALVARHRPDIVILDVGIPGEPAVHTVGRILEIAPETSVIILSMFDEPALIRELLAAGSCAYLLKTIGWRDLVAAVRGVRADASRAVLAISRETAVHVSGAGPRPLSDREVEVVGLVGRALSNSQIARRLDISEGTVKRHLRNVFTKLGAVSRIDAVNKATALNLISSPQSPMR